MVGCRMGFKKFSNERKSANIPWVYFLKKRLSEEYEYSYDDMIEGGEVNKEIISLMEHGNHKIFL